MNISNTKPLEELYHLSEENPDQGYQLLTAALLVEMMRKDDEILADEIDAVIQLLQRNFELPLSRAKALYKKAEPILKTMADYSPVTLIANQYFSYEQRVKITELLWEVAYADRQLHRDETQFVLEIGRQLHIEDDDFAECKLRAKEMFV